MNRIKNNHKVWDLLIRQTIFMKITRHWMKLSSNNSKSDSSGQKLMILYKVSNFLSNSLRKSEYRLRKDMNDENCFGI
jgi:hypothetical protein